MKETIKEQFKKDKPDMTLVYIKDADRVLIKGLSKELEIPMFEFISYLVEEFIKNNPSDNE